MNSNKFLVAISMLKAKSRPVIKLSLLIFLILAACQPASIPAAAVEVVTTPSGTIPTASQAPATATMAATQPATATPEEQVIYPYYRPLATKPDVAPQTIKSVTAQIDWVYVDESRVALHFTLSGLGWPDGTQFDSMSVQIKSAVVPDIGFGGGGWNSTEAKQGVITGTSDQLLRGGDLDAQKHPSIDLSVDIPVDDSKFQFKFEVPVLDGIEMENLEQTVTANNVWMTLKTLVVNPSRVEALICFQMPSPVDWGLGAATLSMGGKEYPFAGSGLLPGTDGKNFRLTDPDRCITIGFEIVYDKSATSVTLTIPMLMGSIPEVIEKDRVERANQRLAEKGIEFDYANVDHGGNIVIKKRPEGMTDPEIYPLIWDALADQYPGPWVFTVPIKR